MSKDASQPGRASENTTDDRHVVYRTVHDWNGRESLSDTVLTAVSEAAGIDPIDLPTLLIDSVDPDALDALFRPRHDDSSRRNEGHLEFTTSGYEIVVYSDGRVFVRDPDQV